MFYYSSYKNSCYFSLSRFVFFFFFFFFETTNVNLKYCVYRPVTHVVEIVFHAFLPLYIFKSDGILF